MGVILALWWVMSESAEYFYLSRRSPHTANEYWHPRLLNAMIFYVFVWARSTSARNKFSKLRGTSVWRSGLH